MVGYLPALLLGIVAAADLLPLPTLLGTAGLWVSPGGDLAENLTGHLALQATPWHWPLLLAPNLAWPHGTSVAMTDSNPLLSLLAKLLAGIRGGPINLLGYWLGACWLLQPIAAVYALRGFGRQRWEAEIAAAAMAILFPALLARVTHINLMGQFLVLFALGMALRMLRNGPVPPRRWVEAAALLSVAVLCHPYLYVFAAAALAMPILQAVLDRQANAGRSACWYVAALTVPVALFALLSGTIGGGDRGFGFYSMNLLSPFWPQRSGLFGAATPVIDATGGQYEGFNYLGAGAILLLVVAAPALFSRRFAWRRWRGLIIVLAALTSLALSSRIYLGHMLILDLGVRPWDQAFGAIQASGRAFWLVGYTLLLASIAGIARRLSPAKLRVVLAVAVLLQFVDTMPLRAAAREYFAGRHQQPAPIALPPGARWLADLPVCTRTARAAEVAGTLRLAAIRADMWLRDMRVSRLPRWFNCESALTDGLETPLMSGEVRVFLEPPATTLFRPAALGPGAVCRGVEQMIVCTRDIPPEDGTAVAPGPALPAVATPVADVTGAALAPLRSFGWRIDATGLAWSEGPRVTLLFRLAEVDPSGSLSLRLQLDGIARSAGGVRPIIVRVNAAPPVNFDLEDMQPTELELRVRAASLSDGVVRLVVDIDHPVDPRDRGLIAPVGRAGVRLRALSAQWLEH